MMFNKMVYTLFILSFVLVVGSIMSIKFLSPAPKPKAYQTVYTGKANIGGEFHLRDTKDNIVHHDQFHGKYLLVYFGFTYCPDICPTSLHTITSVLERLSPATLQQVVPLFITIDPKRDTQEHLKAYISSFHPAIIALTGSEEEVQQAINSYRVYRQVRKGNPEEKNYLIDHSSFIYLMDRNGKYVNHFAHNADPSLIVELINNEVAK